MLFDYNHNHGDVKESINKEPHLASPSMHVGPVLPPPIQPVGPEVHHEMPIMKLPPTLYRGPSRPHHHPRGMRE